MSTVQLGDLTVNRMGFGTMQLTGPGVWGPPDDPDAAVAVLRRAVDLGVTFVDTADSYGPGDSEDLLRRALHPYPEDLVIATKAGMVRPAPGEWAPMGHPAYLRQCVELSLRRLHLEQLPLLQLHRVDQAVPLADQLGELTKMQAEGKIRHIGLSEVPLALLEEAQQLAPIVSVQNIYNAGLRHHDEVVDRCEADGVVFLPFFPLGAGELLADERLRAAATEADATPAQLALAWLLRRSPAIAVIPGTSSLAHLEENVAAVDLELSEETYEALSQLA
jgi:aryl-alcohol dehydrogenase-like predicted oxidoreductase